MRKQRLTQLTVDRLKLKPGERVQIPDRTVAGLELRASTGTKAFWLRYRHDGRQWRHRLGEHPGMSLSEARAAARAFLVQLDQGVNPLAPVETKGTVHDVYEQWLARDQSGNRTVGETKRILEREILPAWGERPIESVRRRDVIELVDGVVDRGAPIQANRVLAHIKRLFRWATARDLIEYDPAAAVEKPVPERVRDRVLDDAELAAVWQACASMGVFGAGVQLLILTGARRAEVFEATWAEVRLDGPEPALVLPAERVKVAEGRVIPLSAPAVAILRVLPRRRAHEFVVSLTGEHPLGSIGKLKRRLDARLPDVPAWTLHDLRRATATGLQRLGIQLQVIEAVLGHVSGSRAGIVGTYQRHRFEAEARAALDTWGAHVTAKCR